MAKKFQELVKNFDTIRRYARDFYIYGFKERDEFSYGSKRGYDNERRRIESYLTQWIAADVVQGKKRVRLEFDSTTSTSNPLAQVWGAKSFTKNDVFLHFVLLDILSDGEPWTIQELVDEIDEKYLLHFTDGYLLDSLTIRKKVKEYTALGFFNERKQGRECFYILPPQLQLSAEALTAVDFYKEVFPVGILGEFIRNAQDQHEESPSQFKHVFPVQTLDSQVTMELLQAIHLRREIAFQTDRQQFDHFLPIKVCSSCESGRQYLIGHVAGIQHLYSIRINFITQVRMGEEAPQFDHYHAKFLRQKEVTWNAAFTTKKAQLLKVFLKIDESKEAYLIRRLEKEGRQGRVERIGDNQFLFSIALVDMVAINPFLRTFFGRIERIQCTNRAWEKRFWQDYRQLYQLYIGGEGDESALS